MPSWILYTSNMNPNRYSTSSNGFGNLFLSAGSLTATGKTLEENMEMGQIAESMTDRVIFLTGSTGFVGRNLILKLIKLPVLKVYCLIRGDDPGARLRGLGITDSRFIPIGGDITKNDLGIGHLSEFVDKIDYFIHCAANVRFTLGLGGIYKDNVIGTMNVAEFAFVTIRVKKQFVYVSTAFVSWFLETGSVAEEIVYPACHTLQELSVNAYVHSKASVERMLESMFTGYQSQILIARLSIVGHAVEEPYPGWMTPASPLNFLLNGQRQPKDCVGTSSDVIPVDIASNSILTHMIYQGKSPRKLVVVQIGAGSHLIKNELVSSEKFRMSQTIPGAVIDKIYSIFLRKQIIFNDRATQELLKNPMYHPLDRANFPIDVGNLDHESYIALPLRHMRASLVNKL